MKRIIVIGASSGLGRLTALAFAQMGWKVGIAARREDRLRELAQKFPQNIVYRPIDVTSESAAAQFNSLIDDLGGMDVMLYAAGCGWYNPNLDPADEKRTIDVNVQGFTTIIDAAYIYFKNNGINNGCIAAITSIAGTRGLGLSAAYSATKRYQWTYLQALDQLAHSDKVKLNIVELRPGFARTNLISRGPQQLPMTMSPDYVTRHIVRAIIHKRRITVIDWRWAIVTALWRLIPRNIWRCFPTAALLKAEK